MGKPRHYIREWRKFRGYTQEKLAEQTPYTTGAISQLETGRTNYTQPILEALAEALNCSPGDLISRDPNMAGDNHNLLNGLSPEQLRLAKNMIETIKRSS